ncbi:DedA family protein [Pseudomarimonas arenosa]|uniref:VTT domain-containing protein n=1 Tax=Pseudomarimonas arenosa TaxID=2774145 RepID=A0AAW3ZGG6_9GAMM|nr:DedA family protein [Pseudomarimonas arenosa]MBD8525106.1 VTT domain-containing protein [Pseudomarimonas arenosa]
MLSVESVVAWATQHPILAGGLVFLIAFVDALLIVGAVVPAIPLLFALGTLIGLNVLEPISTLTLAAFGAFCGDGISYLIGRRYGTRLSGIWPFSRYPGWLASGQEVFDRHGSKGIFIGRFVGAIRPFVPAIAGMLRLPPTRYTLASALAASVWSVVFIAPGWLFGSVWQQLEAVAGPLLIILLGSATVLLAVVYLGQRIYRWAAPRGTLWVERALAWSRAHPQFGRLTRGLVDPTAPESTSLVLLALILLALLAGAGVLLLNQQWQQEFDPSFWRSLRSPWSDVVVQPMLSLADPLLLAGLVSTGVLWSIWRRSTQGIAHWLAAAAVGLLIDACSAALWIADERSAWHWPLPACLASVGSLSAIIVARESRQRYAARPYMLSSAWVALYGFALLYFGLAQSSQTVFGVALGSTWGMALGIAYRRHSLAAPGIPRFAKLAGVALMALFAFTVINEWSATRHRQQLATHTLGMDRPSWWQPTAAALPSATGKPHPGPELLYAGPLESLQSALNDGGWYQLGAAKWSDPLQLLNADLKPSDLPIMPLARDGYGELARWERVSSESRREVMLLWPSRWTLDDGRPVFRLQVVPHRLARFRGGLRIWLPDPASEINTQKTLASLAPPLQALQTAADWRLQPTSTRE